MYSYNTPKKSLLQNICSLKYYLFDNPSKYLKSVSNASYFSCGKNHYQYARFLKNAAYSSERSIEIPIVMEYVNECKGDILEVGNVLNHYCKFPHTVVDKYEHSKNVINTDIVEYVDKNQYDLIVSISTLEHVGFDEEAKDRIKILKALDKIFSLTKPGGTIIITVPLGHNLFMDTYIKDEIIKAPEMHLMKRISDKNEWEEKDLKLLRSEKFNYGSPFPFGNWVLILIWKKVCQ